MIIYINGSSSSGKSSIVKKIKEILEKPIVSRSVDTFLDLIDDKFFEIEKKAHYGCKLTQTKDEKGYNVKIEKGELWVKIYNMMLDTINNFAKNGFDIVVDDCTDEIDRVKQHLCYNDVLFIKTTCPIEEMSQREINRGDRILGTARGTMEMVDNVSFKYDLVIDTSKKSSLELAKRIIKFAKI